MSAAPIDLSVSIAPESVNLAEIVELEVRAALDLEWTLVGDPLAELAAGAELGGFTVERISAARPTIEDGRLINEWTLELAPATTGRAEVPPLTFRAEQPGGSSAPSIVETPALGVDVVSLLESAGEDFQPATLVAPIEAPAPPLVGGPGALILGILIGAALTIAAVWLIARSRRRPVVSPVAALRRRMSELDTPTDDRERALAAAAISRDALALELGPSARAATPGELARLLAAGGRVASADELAALDLVERAERAAYAPGAESDSDLDPRPIVEAIARAFTARGAAP